MLLPRSRRGGTMRPENSSKLWLKTACEWSRASTPCPASLRSGRRVIAAWEMPLAAASVLKSASQASNVPVLQATAAARCGRHGQRSADGQSTAIRETRGQRARSGIDLVYGTKVSEHEISAASAAKTWLIRRLAAMTQPESAAAIKPPADMRPAASSLALSPRGFMRRPCAARRTTRPGNPPQSAVHSGARGGIGRGFGSGAITSR